MNWIKIQCMIDLPIKVDPKDFFGKEYNSLFRFFEPTLNDNVWNYEMEAYMKDIFSGVSFLQSLFDRFLKWSEKNEIEFDNCWLRFTAGDGTSEWSVNYGIPYLAQKLADE